MSTTATEKTAARFYTPAEVEAALAANPAPAAANICQALCKQIQNDLDILENLDKIPAAQRAQVRAVVVSELHSAAQQMKQRHCPACKPM